MLTQEQLAERVGTTTATISRLETGKQPYTQPLLEGIADVLACEVQDLIARLPDEPQDQVQRLLARLGSDRARDFIKMIEAVAEPEPLFPQPQIMPERKRKRA